MNWLQSKNVQLLYYFSSTLIIDTIMYIASSWAEQRTEPLLTSKYVIKSKIQNKTFEIV